MKWQAQAPANIALIKYMGKVDTVHNLPANPSLSYTLKHLCSTVELQLINERQDRFEPFPTDNGELQLSQAGIARFLAHLHRIKDAFKAGEYHFFVRSRNNFPSDCGLASSASSFAALTQAACAALAELTRQPLPWATQAQLSQKGSGSSCRSFYDPWCLWEENHVRPLDLPYERLLHQVIVVSRGKKAISSSTAHRLVTSSLLFENRPQRAKQRCKDLIAALQSKQWAAACDIVWQEFWDMHALFETSQPPFGYISADAMAALNTLRIFRQQENDGPLITMDAGPNIHLLYRADQLALAQNIAEHFRPGFSVLTSYE